MNPPKRKKSQRKSNGFLIVASRRYSYYVAAHQLIDSLLDNMPDAKIALFAHDEWTKDDDRCDKLYLVKDCPGHKRAKLWALPQTPFDKTVYIDADCYVCHEDVENMFDFDSHLIFTNIRPYAGKVAKFIGGEMVLHGGVFGYQSDPNTIEFMQDWWEYYEKQADGTWWPSDDIGPKEKLEPWDQFTLWWLVNYKYKDKIKIAIYNDDARYNFVHIYKEDECEGEIIVWHYTIPGDHLRDERNIYSKPGDLK